MPKRSSKQGCLYSLYSMSRLKTSGLPKETHLYRGPKGDAYNQEKESGALQKMGTCIIFQCMSIHPGSMVDDEPTTCLGQVVKRPREALPLGETSSSHLSHGQYLSRRTSRVFFPKMQHIQSESGGGIVISGCRFRLYSMVLLLEWIGRNLELADCH